ASTDKGQHTTTVANMYEVQLADDGAPEPGSAGPDGHAAPTFIIDTPGVKGFGLVDMAQEEIVDQFPEFLNLRAHCRFGNCKHMQEPGCAVLEALEQGEVAESRYNSYIDMVEGVDEHTSYRK